MNWEGLKYVHRLLTHVELNASTMMVSQGSERYETSSVIQGHHHIYKSATHVRPGWAASLSTWRLFEARR